MIHKYYIGLGSNIPPQITCFKTTIKKLNSVSQSEIAMSSVYRSHVYHNDSAISFLSKNIFFNMALMFSSELEPLQFIEYCQSIEQSYGKKISERKQKKVWYDRKIDIDILLIDELILNYSHLVVPHYDLTNRVFVLKPLLELDSSLIHPQSGIALSDYYDKLSEKEKTSLVAIGEIKELNLNVST